jgi:hypothetical protein
MLTEDQTGLRAIVKCNMFLKLVQILITLACTSYFFAMLFRFVIQLESDILNYDEYGEKGVDEPEHFLTFYGFADRTDY